MDDGSPHVVLCNGAALPQEFHSCSMEKCHRLEYSTSADTRNVKLLLPGFGEGLYHHPDCVLDLLEIAAYCFCADRLLPRGRKSALEYHGWARSIQFVIRVRDYDFWADSEARAKLIRALTFMSGDREYGFTFQPGHSRPPSDLFDSAEFAMQPKTAPCVVLFSGGVDSLAGAVERLRNSDQQVCLVSHVSGQPSTAQTQQVLFQALQKHFARRVHHYSFRCGLHKVRAADESQRTRGFLYTAIAYALAHALGEDQFTIYENGVTALNFPRRQSLMNARASRTTHPQTLALLADFFSEVAGKRIRIETPFLWCTKAEVLNLLAESDERGLITSAVSCSQTFQNLGRASHCGGCFQCIDRRFAAYAAEVDDVDECGIYSLDFIRQSIDDGEIKTTLVDYVRQACAFATWNVDHFHDEYLTELADLVDYLPPSTEEPVGVQKVWNLCRRHGEQVLKAVRRMREVHDDPLYAPAAGSFLSMINEREYLKEPVKRLVDAICDRLRLAIPIAFQGNPPKNEGDFNDKVSALLSAEKDKFDREHPAVAFALARVEPDHSCQKHNLLVESKYIRGSTTPSKATEGMAADLVKYPEDAHVLFVVYDPCRAIRNDRVFGEDFQAKGRCTVCILR